MMLGAARTELEQLASSGRKRPGTFCFRWTAISSAIAFFVGAAATVLLVRLVKAS
jgi:hypothetical protein